MRASGIGPWQLSENLHFGKRVDSMANCPRANQNLAERRHHARALVQRFGTVARQSFWAPANANNFYGKRWFVRYRKEKKDRGDRTIRVFSNSSLRATCVLALSVFGIRSLSPRYHCKKESSCRFPLQKTPLLH